MTAPLYAIISRHDKYFNKNSGFNKVSSFNKIIN